MSHVTPVLEIRDLCVQFPTRKGLLKAVDGISLDIHPGEVLGVVGESGAGKSMTGMTGIGAIFQDPLTSRQQLWTFPSRRKSPPCSSDSAASMAPLSCW